MFGALKHRHDSGAVLSVDGVRQSPQVLTEAVDDRQQLVAVRQTDVVPHLRVAGGDPGKVPKTAGGITKDLCPVIQPRQRIHQGIGQDMRQMAGGRQLLSDNYTLTWMTIRL